MTLTCRYAAALIVCSLAASQAVAAEPAPVQIEGFFKRPVMSGASLSPDGHFVAMRTQSSNGRNILVILNTDTREQKVVANYGNADIENFYWLSDKRLAFSVINVDHSGGIGEPGLYAVDRDGGDFSPLTRTIKAPRSFADTDFSNNGTLAGAGAHGFSPRKQEAMFAMARWEDREELVLLNTRTDSRTPMRAPAKTFHWLIDADGDPRIAVARRKDENVVFYKDGDDWRQIAAFSPVSPEAFDPLLFVDGTLYIRAYNGANESAVYRYDLKKNAIIPEPVIKAPGFDTDGRFLVDEKRLLGYRLKLETETTVWFDKDMKALQADVDALLPGRVNNLSYGDHNTTPFVVINSYSDVQSNIYLLYNRESKKLLKLGATHPDLDIMRMAETRMIRYPARDGMQIPAYVTVPEAGPKKMLPTVVLMGEKQWSRNGSWGWNDEVQFLASRGYLVLRPDPRGVDGFGRTHREAGAKQWGRAIQDDIADVVKWSVQQGYTDPARVCIAGSGYGGYAAMMGLIRDPQVFKCGISWSGITDIGIMFKNDWDGLAATRATTELRAMVGDPKLDAAQFNEVSPLQNAARIHQPVLLAYGKEDQRVRFSDGLKFYEKLSATNPGVEWLTYSPSVSDWKTQANRIDLWKHIEAFLGRNIGPSMPAK
ncbi:S9 family peptidase [Duganella sp. S19_KUP01_CR8]|uniref:S9 family peptidase n=1 Tax=Duganella sp. S19_KUP01_CR8 TaxID=3025502 RepID=UPI002FCD8BC1